MIHDFEADCHRAVALKRSVPGQQRVKYHPEREEIGTSIHSLSVQLLRSDVSRASEYLTGNGQMRPSEFRDTEIRDLRIPLFRNKNVLRLNIAMHHAPRMRVVERFCCLLNDAKGHWQ